MDGVHFPGADSYLGNRPPACIRASCQPKGQREFETRPSNENGYCTEAMGEVTALFPVPGSCGS